MNTEKIIQSICYLVSKQQDGVLDTMKVYKLLWLCDRLHIRRYSRTVSGDDYFALPYGPVPSTAKNLVDGKYKGESGFSDYIAVLPKHQIKAVAKPKMDEFSESDIEIMDAIWEEFGNMTAVELSNYSHTFPEWIKYESALKDSSKKNGYKIDKDLFFVNKEEKSGLFVDDEEILDMTKEVYHQYRLS